ncbi:Zn(II)2Cys6 transcription factor [Aspergillus ibericus CBS 121593]|uniref:Zn(2)-C6 fungal-type domain-containing protein n=1 Tax=Aspergillus ibericus CBS 121593 TaxID=1448316 RepID=A0A395GT95_9EURO|nr:hypothetical protein BO80DRAFT_458270 [Aspergillus ibericus CBS 121593]RAK97303.1 hypothetical protein BO80DRAFT_458270 [Aspergillus ibericus CBS 121593]
MASSSAGELSSRLNRSGKPRQKQWRSRSKTGCITCRIRRVKCDESKPSCQKCTSTGRKCDGYQDPSTKQTSWRRSRRTGATPAQTQGMIQMLSPWDLIGHKPLENEYFNYFRLITTPSLVGFFDTGIWSYKLLQVSHHYPALWHAMAALASLHRHFLEDGEPITSVQGFHWQAFTHIGSALMLCHHWSLGSKKHESVDMSALVILLAQLDSQARPLYLLQQMAIPWVQTRFLLPATEICFTSLSEAHESLEVHVNNMLQFFSGSTDLAGAERLARMEKCQDDFRQWDARLAQYLATSPHDTDNKPLKTLYLRRLYAKVMLGLDPAKGELAHDEFTDDYTEMVELASAILEDHGSSLKRAPVPIPHRSKRHFSLESTVTESLFLVAARCREPATRQRALRLMQLHPRREGICGTMLALCVGEKLIEVEGTACKAAPPGSCADGRWVCANHRVVVLRFADLTERKISVEMITRGEVTQGLPGKRFVFHKTW